jgi:hypothetical protein
LIADSLRVWIISTWRLHSPNSRAAVASADPNSHDASSYITTARIPTNLPDFIAVHPRLLDSMAKSKRHIEKLGNKIPLIEKLPGPKDFSRRSTLEEDIQKHPKPVNLLAFLPLKGTLHSLPANIH